MQRMFQKILIKIQYWKGKTNMETFIQEGQDEVPLTKSIYQKNSILYV